LTAELTVGESFFFRNEYHFQALRERVLPVLLRENQGSRALRIWHAGCAGGEEPYSMAILLDQLLQEQAPWQISILATDINPEFLQRARQARYRLWSFRLTQIQQNSRYFTAEGDWFCLTPALREQVRFHYLNLVKDVYPSPLTGTLGLDLILFRNVAIYLRPEVVAEILGRFYRALRPGGWLLLGETEVTLAPAQGFLVQRFERATFFQKPPDATAGVVTGLAPTLPVLASFLPQVQAAMPLPISVPQWVPLPAPARQPRTKAASPWDEIQRCLSQQQFAEAERLLDRIPDPRQRARTRLQYIRALLHASQLTRTRTLLERCLGEDPLLLEAQLLRGSFAEEDGDLAAAEAAYRRALYIDRHCIMAHFHLALVQQQRPDETAARRSLTTVLKLAEGKDIHAVVEHGEGVSYGRLLEMVNLLLNSP
jgi:chemotaxis protein methyltransferase CheR